MNVDEDKKMNASYIISVARKLGCSIFMLPEDIVEVRTIDLFSQLIFSSNQIGSVFNLLRYFWLLPYIQCNSVHEF